MSKIKQRGQVLFSNIVTQPVFQGKPTGKYELTLILTPEQAADAEHNGLGVTRKEYQGQEQFTIKCKTKFPLNTKSCVNRDKTPYTDDLGQVKEIPRGSEVGVILQPKPYEMMGKEGITNYLIGVQVIHENADLEFDDFDDEDEYENDDSEY